MSGDGGHGTDHELFEDVGRKVESLQDGHKKSDKTSTSDENDDAPAVDEIESLCMNCHEMGTTRLLLTRIPFFREVVLMSFYCPHCFFKNSEIQSAGQIQERGCRYKFVLAGKEDFARQVIKSETCRVKFLELDIEIPPGRGQITNVEGLLSSTVDDLELRQPVRKIQEPEAYAKLEELIGRARKMLNGEDLPITVTLDDPTGNSAVQPSPNNADHRWSRSEYERTAEQNEALSLGNADKGASEESSTQTAATAPDFGGFSQEEFQSEIVPDEVYSFPASCPGCTRPCTTQMKMVDIPHFKEVVIMSTVCDQCGYRSNEIKTGGAVSSQGQRITLKVERPEDLARDILKSESCAFSSPELNLSINPGTLGGRFTTVEGLLSQVRDDLHSQIFDTGLGNAGGDSLEGETKQVWDEFFARMDRAIKVEEKFTVVLEDPLASSYVQSLTAPKPDPQLTIEEYERTFDENEDLGLNDIDVGEQITE